MPDLSKELDGYKTFFPLTKIKDVIDLIKHSISSGKSPNLAFISILVGFIENQLTVKNHQFTPELLEARSQLNPEKQKNGSNGSNGSSNGKESSLTSPWYADAEQLEIPKVEWDNIHSLYQDFIRVIKRNLKDQNPPTKTTREFMKKLIEAVWNGLHRGDTTTKSHHQSLFSYVTEHKLDRFGVSLAVFAACQVLEIDDVKLAVTEDHAWVVFGDPENQETAEILWRGKGSEDRRGKPVIANSWLYLNGYPVLCGPAIALGALFASLNPMINTNAESEQLIVLQRKLMWALYDEGLLATYPMGIDYLGYLEELNPTQGATKDAHGLFKEAIEVSLRMYKNQHVYPWHFLASHYFRSGRYKEALKYWAATASVIRGYNYSRDDEEIYKEFLLIVSDFIPHMLKNLTAGGFEPGNVSKIPLLQDPDCFTSLLAFYDGLCGWEEGSSTPVLHIGWAKPFVSIISKFPFQVRNKAKIEVKYGETLKNIKESDESQSKSSDQKTSGDTKAEEEKIEKKSESETKSQVIKERNGNNEGSKCVIYLKSQKMIGLKDLLLAKKLNTSAITLQITAQSQSQEPGQVKGLVQAEPKIKS